MYQLLSRIVGSCKIRSNTQKHVKCLGGSLLVTPRLTPSASFLPPPDRGASIVMTIIIVVSINIIVLRHCMLYLHVYCTLAGYRYEHITSQDFAIVPPASRSRREASQTMYHKHWSGMFFRADPCAVRWMYCMWLHCAAPCRCLSILVVALFVANVTCAKP